VAELFCDIAVSAPNHHQSALLGGLVRPSSIVTGETVQATARGVRIGVVFGGMACQHAQPKFGNGDGSFLAGERGIALQRTRIVQSQSNHLKRQRCNLPPRANPVAYWAYSVSKL